MAEQKYPKSCDIHVRFGASGSVNIKMIKSSHTVYEGICQSGKYHYFRRDQILTPEQVAEEEEEWKARSMAVGTVRVQKGECENGMTEFTRSLLDKAAAEKIKADLLKEQSGSTSTGTKAQSKSKEDKQKPSNYHESQVSCL